MQSRRDFLKTINLAALSGVAASYVPQVFARNEAVKAIKNAAKNAGVHYGAHNENNINISSPKYQKLFIDQCELYAPNFTWGSSLSIPYTSDFHYEDPNIAFANQHAMQLTGGHLLWHDTCPRWFSSIDDPGKEIFRYADIINNRYKNKIYSWNVVNEAIYISDGRIDGLRTSTFLRKMGTDYFRIAFNEAKSAAPNILRVYNDYGFELDNKDDEAKRTALLKLLDKFKNENIPVQGIGLQSHLRLGYSFNEIKYRHFLKEISDRGYKILITELDVFDLDIKVADLAARDNMVADMYKKFLSVALDEKAVKCLVTWGIEDSSTWLIKKKQKMDNRNPRPLFFDENLNAKPAYYAILDALKNAPKRKLS